MKPGGAAQEGVVVRQSNAVSTDNLGASAEFELLYARLGPAVDGDQQGQCAEPQHSHR